MATVLPRPSELEHGMVRRVSGQRQLGTETASGNNSSLFSSDTSYGELDNTAHHPRTGIVLMQKSDGTS